MTPQEHELLALKMKPLADAVLTLSAEAMASIAMLRALYTHHPEQEKVKATFDFLIAQHLTHQACLDNPSMATMLRGMAEVLTRPPMHLD